jgi:transcriptional regulator GlxA family with amidase domain
VARANQPRRVVLVAFPGLQALDLVGPAEVFAAAALAAPPGYVIAVAAPTDRPLRTSSGLTLTPDTELNAEDGSMDTLIVCGGAGVVAALDDAALMAWLPRAAGRARRVASVCNGAFLLAAAALLDGRRATTHWAACDELARRHPEVAVERDAIFVRDGDVYTSAGVTAGMDLALALVEEDLGPAVSRQIARQLVLFLRRPGGQSQFSSHLAAGPAERPPLRELQGWIADHLADDLSVPALAARAHMSPRNFARAFRRETSLTPAAYVGAVRLEHARMALEEGDEPIDAVARRCGFGTVETMRRAFRRRLHVAPSDYRTRFRDHAHHSPGGA